jgi:hypothetical protein
MNHSSKHFHKNLNNAFRKITVDFLPFFIFIISVGIKLNIFNILFC